ncbi:MAG TPA: DUF4303 domain-containing protein [Polyangiaceae bacterium]|nr:DUF4303 domain-containing protein [Polyangiaceae bacterium]
MVTKRAVGGARKATKKPAGAARKPAKATPKPAGAARKPAKATPKPTGAARKRAATTPKPTEGAGARRGRVPKGGGFGEALERALTTACAELDARIGSERLYALVLYTSGEADFSYLCASAGTEEGLTRIAARYAASDSRYAGEAGRRDLRWSIADWELHDFATSVSELELPPGSGADRDRELLAVFSDALARAATTGPLARRRPAPILAVACGDMSHDFFLRSLARLNPPAVVAEYRREHTPGPFLDELSSLPPARRLEVVLGLFRDLTLARETPIASDARRRNVSAYALEPLVTALGAAAVPRLLDWVEEHGFGPAFNEEGSEAWKRHGAVTPESRLASAAVGLVGKIGLGAPEVERLQAILARRVDLDREAKPPVSSLAVIIARVLHRAFPGRFPQEKQNSRTNRLDNAAAFLPS